VMMTSASLFAAIAVVRHPQAVLRPGSTSTSLALSAASPTASAVALKSELLAAIDSHQPQETVKQLTVQLSETQAIEDVDVPRLLLGDWRTLFSTLKMGNAKSVPLKMLSFGVMPSRPVFVGDWYNRVSEQQYTLMPQVRSSEQGVSAGLALTGWCGFDAAPGRCSVQFESVGLVPAIEGGTTDQNSEAVVRELLEGSKLEESGPQRPASIFRWLNAHKTFIDITYIDDDIRIHTGKSGEVYVLERLPASDGIPFMLP